MGRIRVTSAAAGAIGLFAGAIMMVPSESSAVPPVPPARAGTIEVWGTATVVEDLVPVRVSHSIDGDPWAAVALGSAGTGFAVKTSGDLVRLGGTSTDLNIPTDVATADVVAISTVGSKAAVALEDGSFHLWGDSRNLGPRSMTPAELGGKATDVAIGGGSFVVILLDSGKVGLLTSSGYEVVTQDGSDVTGAVEIAALGAQGFARLEGGGVFAFGATGPTLVPPVVSGETLTDPVVSIAAGPNSGTAVAATEGGDVYTWDATTGELLEEPYTFPTDAITGKVVEVAATGRYFAARADSGQLLVWGQNSDSEDYHLLTGVPEEVAGHHVTELFGGASTFAAIVSSPPTAPASSTTTVNATTTAYGTSGSVIVTTGSAGGLPIAGSITLSGAGPAQSAPISGGKTAFTLDKTLAPGSYTLSATYSGSADLSASSGNAVYTVAKGKSGTPAFKTNKAPTSRKRGKATAIVSTGSGLAKATGKATITLKKGKTSKKISVTLSGGKKSISLPKLKKGTWKVQVSYNGDKNYVAQKSKSYNLKIKK